MSDIIFSCYYRKNKNIPLDLDVIVEKYKLYWQDINIKTSNPIEYSEYHEEDDEYY
jgi:hypothetical protein